MPERRLLAMLDRIVSRIVSGGQTGVDRAALDAALELGLPVSGWCPQGRHAEDGTIGARYPLRETDETNPEERTRRNVGDADATLVLAHDAPGGEIAPGYVPGSPLPEYPPTCVYGGTRTTAEWAQHLSKPLRLADPRKETQIEGVAAWIARQGIRTLNVAGPRESECPGIYGEAKEFLLALLAASADGKAPAMRRRKIGRRRCLTRRSS